MVCHAWTCLRAVFPDDVSLVSSPQHAELISLTQPCINAQPLSLPQCALQGELQSILGHEDLSSTPILVLANKQDLRDAMSVEEMSTALALTEIRSHPWHIQPCCALSGQGLHDGMEWIAQRVNKLRT